MRYSVLGILFLAVFLSMGCIGTAGFAQYNTDFSNVLNRNGSDTQNLVPPTLEQLNALELEITALQETIKKQGISTDQQAILLLIEMELNLIHMQQNILVGQEQAQFANLAFPSCEPTSNLGKAISFFDQAKTQATLAGKNLDSFTTDYPAQSQQTQIDFEILKTSILGSQQSITQSKQIAEQFCP
ncbi:hypothetical protein KKE06_02490 [Candidatus Micrarchaeota archaeon]|nr:hypothetical protein [Candidatus Micrarchaeota archaeon]MBU1930092.1 hypothetical protein [Candidatus Micrarchaeota archaeon]